MFTGWKTVSFVPLLSFEIGNGQLTASTSPAEAAENRISAPGARAGGASLRIIGCPVVVVVEMELLSFFFFRCSSLLLFFTASSHSCSLIIGGEVSSVDGEEEEALLAAAAARGANHGGIENWLLKIEGGEKTPKNDFFFHFF